MPANKEKYWFWTRISMKDNHEFNQSSCSCMNTKCCWSLSAYQVLLALISMLMGFIMGIFLYEHILQPTIDNRMLAVYRCVGYLTTWGFTVLYLYVLIQTASSFFPNIWSGFKVLTWLLRNVAICTAFSISFMYWIGYFKVREMISNHELIGLEFLNSIDVHLLNSVIAFVSLVFGSMPIHLKDFDLSLYFYTIYYFFYLYWCNFVIGDYLYFSQSQLTDLQQSLLMLAPFVVMMLSQFVMCGLSKIVQLFSVCYCQLVQMKPQKKKMVRANPDQNMAAIKIAPEVAYTKRCSPYQVVKL